MQIHGSCSLIVVKVNQMTKDLRHSGTMPALICSRKKVLWVTHRQGRTAPPKPGSKAPQGLHESHSQGGQKILGPNGPSQHPQDTWETHQGLPSMLTESIRGSCPEHGRVICRQPPPMTLQGHLLCQNSPQWATVGDVRPTRGTLGIPWHLPFS